MSIRHDKVRFGSRPAAITAAAAFALALLGVGAGNAVAAPAGATIAPDAASAVVAVAAGTQYTVHAGQSLNDVAIAVTLSHDRAVLARATRALFDTNPAAFMNHDPSRMRVGAVLIVPALDASGALAASSGGAAAGASESSAAAPASAPMAAPAAAAASTASAVAQVNAATASAASAAAPAATPAAPAVSGAAAGGGLSSAPAGQAPSAASATAPATTAARAASQPHPKVSSLQQLLALKNRVLMELQKHGIGGAPVASSPAPTSAAQPAAPGSAAAATVVPEHANVAMSPSDEGGMSQRELSIAAAVGAALVVLLAALRMSRRKREKEAAARAAEAVDAERTRSAREADSRDGSAVAGHPVTEGSDARDQEVARQAAAAAAAERAAAESAAAERAAAESAAAAEEAAERAAAERVAAERAAAEQAAAEQAGAEQAAAEHAAAEHAAAEQAAAERIAAERAAAELAAQQGGTPEPAAPTAPLASIPLSTGSEPSAESRAVAPAHDETLRSAATAANLAAAAELGADALPLGPLEPVIGGTEDEGAHRPKWDDESTESPTDKTTGTPATPTPSPTETPSVAPHIATAEPQPPLDVPPPVIDFTQHQIEPRTTTAFAQPFSDIPVPAQPAPSTPTDFPRDAVDAFGSLNMPLPPRIEAPTAGETERPTSLSTQPVASPDTTAQQSIGVHGADDDAPHIADQIAAGTAGHGAVAGLGAAGFGALKLDFDLELPPSPAQPLPAFTAADLGRIARNKLELASEYIELGDLAGARALINEVIEANDPATRNEARALLSTLAPLS